MKFQSPPPGVSFIISLVSFFTIVALVINERWKEEEFPVTFEQSVVQPVPIEQKSIFVPKIWVLPEYQGIVQVAEFEITAYDAYSAQSINVKKYRDGLTALMRPAMPGHTIAVDPKIIPFDSFVFIPGYGWRVAEDVGGDVKGYRIDLLMKTTKIAMKFGRQKMHVMWIPPDKKAVKKAKVKR